MSTQPMNAKPVDDDFYVGYLAIPRSHKRFLQIIIPLFLLSLAMLAVMVAFSARDPGGGVWDDAHLREWTGLVVADPYPYLITQDPQSGRLHGLLLVEIGKLGGGQRANAFAGQFVRVRGYQLIREGREMIELNHVDAAEPAFEILDEPRNLLRGDPVQLADEITIQGEIVDTKCFLGAMKPGEGQAHRACARLCIAGGIPPTLVTPPMDGKRQYILLADRDGKAIGERLLAFVADPVEITGSLWRRDGLLFLYLDPAAVRRLGD